MSIEAICDNCGSRLKAPDTAAGRKLRCPKCQQPTVVPELSAVAAPPPTPTRPCPFCAEPIAIQAIKCRHCNSMLDGSHSPATGTKQVQPSSPPKDPLLMAFLSGCCIAGLGQIILGQTTKGIVFLLANIVLAVVTAGIAALFTWPLMGIDAYLVAKKLKNGQPVTEWESFPT